MGDFMDRLVWITSIVLAICVLTSCGGKVEQTANEAALEKAIEASAAAQGHDVDVDISKGSMNIKTDDGQTSVATGENVEIPADFPKDVPIYPGAKTQMAAMDSVSKGHTLQLLTSDGVDKVSEYYKSEAGNQGWGEDTVMTQGDPQPMTMMSFKKDNRILSLIITHQDDGTSITLTSVSQ